MYKFPVIRHIDDLLEHVAHLTYLAENEKPNGTRVISYIHTDADSFANEWERECRGITFSKEGHILSRTLHKFFNLGEREAYQINNLDFKKVKAIFPKLDGSMISTYKLEGVVVPKSKNSEESDVALAARAYIQARSEYIRFCSDMADRGLTPTFEYTSPENRIVLKYDQEDLTLLQIRENVSGKYLDIHELSKGYDITVLDKAYEEATSFEDLCEMLLGMKDIEGVIVMFEDGDMVKIKTEWYVKLHHSVTFKRYRDIARLVLNESLDDFRGLLAIQQYDAIDFDVLDDIERTIHKEISEMRSEIEEKAVEVKEMFTVDGEMDYKSASAYLKKIKAEPHVFAFVLQTIRGKRIDYLDHYRKRILRDRWSLETIPVSK